MRIRRITVCALFSAIALTIWVVEGLLPPLTPIPGIKPGLANIVTVFTVYYLGAPYAAGVLAVRLVLGAAAGAILYVALYMLKTYVLGITVKGMTTEGAVASMGTKLPASLINAVFATVAAPILSAALHQPLHRMGVLRK